MEPHNHVWVRRGRVFVMRPREFVSRQAAHQWASRNHPEADTMVRPCEKCPTSGVRSDAARLRRIAQDRVLADAGLTRTQYARSVRLVVEELQRDRPRCR